MQSVRNSPIVRTLNVGFCGNPKYLDEFIGSLKKGGHSFSIIDYNRPIADQGKFDVIMHKIAAGEKGRKIIDALLQFQKQHPECTILDDPQCVGVLIDRSPTAEKLADLRVPEANHVVFHPLSIKVHENEPLPDSVKFPAIAKPFLADGSAESHDMALVFTPKGVETVMKQMKVKSLLLQEFINHDAYLHKIYCICDHVFMGARPSLPNLVGDEHLHKDFEFFGRISRNESPEHLGPFPTPPGLELVNKTCQEIRKRLGINLFGVDMITKAQSDPHREAFEFEHYVIDVNYFPSYTGMKSASDLMYNFVLETKGLLDNKGSGA
eukprot:TRINITY_DN2769_c0_g1_i1.p1 TRINITY_DN2769_c0_g1~~TRINITY_DN2769_c0_g1_i1.p1  ORF type:complete len:323 (-),score=60.63 TRINITY_DN2769_c0_g1_i1:114-1082(-)